MGLLCQIEIVMNKIERQKLKVVKSTPNAYRRLNVCTEKIDWNEKQSLIGVIQKQNKKKTGQNTGYHVSRL